MKVVRKRFLKLVLTHSMLLAVLACFGAYARESVAAVGIATVAAGALHPQERLTYQLIHQGGSFFYEKDSVILATESVCCQSKSGAITVNTP